jgi:hypothetical protein
MDARGVEQRAIAEGDRRNADLSDGDVASHGGNPAVEEIGLTDA